MKLRRRSRDRRCVTRRLRLMTTVYKLYGLLNVIIMTHAADFTAPLRTRTLTFGRNANAGNCTSVIAISITANGCAEVNLVLK